jgi:hypothetical protein
MKKLISELTPEKIVLVLTEQKSIRKAVSEFEKIRPTNYTNTILVKMGQGIAWGEIDMCIYSADEQIAFVEKLENDGWEWKI